MQVAAFSDQRCLDQHGNDSAGAAQHAAGDVQFEVLMDPNELESTFSDMLLQVAGTQQGVTGVHVESVQRGGVPFGVLANALKIGWHGLKEQHSNMMPCIDQVSSTQGYTLALPHPAQYLACLSVPPGPRGAMGVSDTAL